jgi:hypothetical protein
MRQAGSKPADDLGLKNADENAMPSALIHELDEEADHAGKHSFAATLHSEGLVGLKFSSDLYRLWSF